MLACSNESLNKWVSVWGLTRRTLGFSCEAQDVAAKRSHDNMRLCGHVDIRFEYCVSARL